MNIPYYKTTLINIAETLSHLFDKDGWIVKTLIGLYFYFSGIHTYMAIIFALVCIDVVSGVIASVKKGDRFNSKKLRAGLLDKFLLYLLLMIAVFLTDMLLKTVLNLELFYLTFFVSFLIAIYECSSITENIYNIRPDIPILASLVGIFNKMQTKTITSMENKTDAIADAITDLKIAPDENGSIKNPNPNS